MFLRGDDKIYSLAINPKHLKVNPRLQFTSTCIFLPFPQGEKQFNYPSKIPQWPNTFLHNPPPPRDFYLDFSQILISLNKST